MMFGEHGSGGNDHGSGMIGGEEHEAGHGYGPGMMGDHGYGSDPGGEDSDGPSAAAMVVILAALIAAAGLGVYWLSSRRGGSAPDSPLETLKRRYAAGELDKGQYEESKRLLEGG